LILAGTSERPSRLPRDGRIVERRRLAWLLLAFLVGGACSNTTLDLFDPDLGLLGHWTLDESQPGGAALDSSGFGNDGTPSAGPPVPTPDVPPVHFPDPYGLSFHGQAQWIDLGNPALLNLGGPLTVAAWIRPASTVGFLDVVAHGYNQNPRFDLALRIRDGNYEFTMWDIDGDHAATAALPASDVGAWVHLCGVFDGSAYRVYRNGALAASTASSAAPQANVDTDWSIGGIPSDRQWSGEIDDVRLYGRALAAAEIAALYQR
jgi:hypothetical protein